ncbi:MAG TPA: hypothetical protein VGC14_20445 [Rhizobium sp.]
MPINTVEIRLQGIEDKGNSWYVSFTWGAKDYTALSAHVEVAKSANDEDIIKIARAKFHSMVKTVAEKSAHWSLDADVWKALEKDKP